MPTVHLPTVIGPQVQHWLAPHVVIVHCPRSGCGYTASAQREGQALNSLAAHLVTIHLAREPQEA